VAACTGWLGHNFFPNRSFLCHLRHLSVEGEAYLKNSFNIRKARLRYWDFNLFQLSENQVTNQKE